MSGWVARTARRTWRPSTDTPTCRHLNREPHLTFTGESALSSEGALRLLQQALHACWCSHPMHRQLGRLAAAACLQGVLCWGVQWCLRARAVFPCALPRSWPALVAAIQVSIFRHQCTMGTPACITAWRETADSVVDGTTLRSATWVVTVIYVACLSQSHTEQSQWRSEWGVFMSRRRHIAVACGRLIHGAPSLHACSWYS